MVRYERIGDMLDKIKLCHYPWKVYFYAARYGGVIYYRWVAAPDSFTPDFNIRKDPYMHKYVEGKLRSGYFDSPRETLLDWEEFIKINEIKIFWSNGYNKLFQKKVDENRMKGV